MTESALCVFFGGIWDRPGFAGLAIFPTTIWLVVRNAGGVDRLALRVPPALMSTKIGGDSLFRIEKIRVFSELFLSRTGRTGCAGDGCEFAFEAGCERYSLAAANAAQADNRED